MLDGNPTVRVSLPVFLIRIARFTCETLFHSRASCVMLGLSVRTGSGSVRDIELWQEQNHNLIKLGAEERETHHA
jgi:hypothetical protein